MPVEGARMTPDDAVEAVYGRSQASRDDLLSRLRARAIGEGSLSDADMEWFQNEKERQLKKRDDDEAKVRRLLEMAYAQQAKQKAPEPKKHTAPVEDVSPTRANADRMFGKEVIQRDPRTWMSEPSPTEEWRKWSEAKQAADKSTGERSLLGALKQFYLSQTEPSKYDTKMSEGDATRMGLGMYASIPTLPLMASASPIAAAITAGSSRMPDYAMGPSTGRDVAADALAGAITQGVFNKAFGTLAAQRPQQPNLNTITQAQLPAPSPLQALGQSQRPALPLKTPQYSGGQMPLFAEGELPPAPVRMPGYSMSHLKSAADASMRHNPDIQHVGKIRRTLKEMEDWGDVSDIPRPVVDRIIRNSYNRPFAKKSGAGLRADPEQMKMMFSEADRPPVPQYNLIDPWGQSYSSIPVMYRNGGLVRG